MFETNQRVDRLSYGLPIFRFDPCTVPLTLGDFVSAIPSLYGSCCCRAEACSTAVPGEGAATAEPPANYRRITAACCAVKVLFGETRVETRRDETGRIETTSVSTAAAALVFYLKIIYLECYW